MFKYLLAAVAAVAIAGSAQAATLQGTFTVDIYQRLNANSAESRALPGNLDPAEFLETITYTGKIDFATRAGSSTTIGSWLATGVDGIVTGLSAGVAALQLSKANIGTGSATTTFFDFVGVFTSGFNSVARHDDGISVYDDGVQIANRANPTSVVNTNVNGFDGGEWRLIYAATNSDPSILKVTGDNLPTTVVPVPAALPLLLVGLGALAVVRRRAA